MPKPDFVSAAPLPQFFAEPGRPDKPRLSRLSPVPAGNLAGVGRFLFLSRPPAIAAPGGRHDAGRETILDAPLITGRAAPRQNRVLNVRSAPALTSASPSDRAAWQHSRRPTGAGRRPLGWAKSTGFRYLARNSSRRQQGPGDRAVHPESLAVAPARRGPCCLSATCLLQLVARSGRTQQRNFSPRIGVQGKGA